MRLIDADALGKALDGMMENEWVQKESMNIKTILCAFKIIIASFETKGPVTCRECCRRKTCRTTTVWAHPPSDDWFCADGKRKEATDAST